MMGRDRSEARAAYSEHVGMKRQPGGSSGEMICLYHLSARTAASGVDMEEAEDEEEEVAEGVVKEEEEEVDPMRSR